MTDEARARILYIEDDEGLAHLARRTLTRQDYEVVPASTLSEGLARFHGEVIDAVVLDHYLPDGTGMDFLVAIGTAVDHVPIIYVTASNEAKVAIDALTGGASDYVVKSIDEDFFPLLIAALKKAILVAKLKEEKERSDRLLLAAKERAEVMLAEMNHRIANSLSLVSAMIRMQVQAVETEETKEALAETQSRISAVAELHRSLYTSDDVAEVDLRNYLGSLIASIESGVHRTHDPVTITHSLESISVSADKAVALGVILTELLTNSLKYAYPEGSGEVRVQLRSNEGECTLTVSDAGVGYDPGVKPRGSGLGTKLIGAMASNLSAAISATTPPDGGSSTEVRWKFVPDG